jgi:alpha-amylase
MDFQIAAGAYCVGEVNNGDNMTYVAEYQGPLNAVLNFPVYWSLRKVFTENQPMTLLKTTLEREVIHVDWSFVLLWKHKT